MVLRILNRAQLATMKPNIQRQLADKIIEYASADDDLECPIRIGNKRVNRPEESAGRMLVEWIDLVVLPNGLRPGLFFMHTPNGLARNATEGGIFKAQGLRKGWPDYSLDLPVGRYHGFRLELKAENGNKPSAEQLDILARLESVGYKCGVAWGFDDGKQQLEHYWRPLVDPTG